MTWIIIHKTERGDKTRRPMVWNNQYGWINRELNATRFNEQEHKCLNLPIDGEWKELE